MNRSDFEKAKFLHTQLAEAENTLSASPTVCVIKYQTKSGVTIVDKREFYNHSVVMNIMTIALVSYLRGEIARLKEELAKLGVET